MPKIILVAALIFASAPASACAVYRFRPAPTITNPQMAWIIENTTPAGAWELHGAERAPSRLTTIQSFDGAPAGVQNLFSCD